MRQRESPWHLRLPTTEHYQWFRNLMGVHELTTSWLKEVQAERPAHLLTRGLSGEVGENLWILDSLSEASLEELLDDTDPGDVLVRLEQTIWVFQSWTLVHLFEKDGGLDPTESLALNTLLEQTSWKLGRDHAESRWQKGLKRSPEDLREILLALNDSPFSGYPTGGSFLIQRAIASEIHLELRRCPHQIHFSEVKTVADTLCRLHAFWIKGFVYALNNGVSVDYSLQVPRCQLRWAH